MHVLSDGSDLCRTPTHGPGHHKIAVIMSLPTRIPADHDG